MGYRLLMMGRKGIIYSLLTLLLLSPLILLSLNYSQSLRGYGRQLGSHIRAQEGFFFMESMHRDLETAGEIIGERAIVAATSYVVTGGKGLDDAPKRLETLFINGTLYGNMSSQMANSTINDWLDRIKIAAAKRAFSVDILPAVFQIDMADPFIVRYRVNYSLQVNDTKKSFSLKVNLTKTSLISIEGLEDPLLPINSFGRAFVAVSKTSYSNYTVLRATGTGANSWGSGTTLLIDGESLVSITDKDKKVLVTREINATNNVSAALFAAVVTQVIVTPATLNNSYVINLSALSIVPNNTRVTVDGANDKVWDIGALYSDWSTPLYAPNDDAPSFLDRLEGSFVNSYPGAGIEAPVRKDRLAANGVPVSQSKTSIDHVYLSNQSSSGQKVKGMPDEFRIDSGHQGYYNVAELVY